MYLGVRRFSPSMASPWLGVLCSWEVSATKVPRLVRFINASRASPLARPNATPRVFKILGLRELENGGTSLALRSEASAFCGADGDSTTRLFGTRVPLNRHSRLGFGPESLVVPMEELVGDLPLAVPFEQ